MLRRCNAGTFLKGLRMALEEPQHDGSPQGPSPSPSQHPQDLWEGQLRKLGVGRKWLPQLPRRHTSSTRGVCMPSTHHRSESCISSPEKSPEPAKSDENTSLTTFSVAQYASASAEALALHARRVDSILASREATFRQSRQEAAASECRLQQLQGQVRYVLELMGWGEDGNILG